MGVIVWKGLYGFITVVLMAIVSGALIYFPQYFFFFKGGSILGHFLIESAVLTLPLAFLDLKRFLREKKNVNTVFLLPVFCLPIVLGILGWMYFSF